MDIREITENTNRHPWETARAKILKKILSKHCNPDSTSKFLDGGCGDVFILNFLLQGLMPKMAHGIDTNLSDEKIQELHKKYNNIHLVNKYDGIKDNKYDIIFLLDIIEHLKEEEKFINDIVCAYLEFNGYMFITVPAFQSLFSNHDVFVRHQRRYSKKELKALLNKCDLAEVASGYLFSSLILPRFLSCCFEKKKSVDDEFYSGPGKWKASRFITKLIEIVFNIENNILFMLSRLGIRIPGLTIWIICKKKL